jgi:hypothetical protein
MTPLNPLVDRVTVVAIVLWIICFVIVQFQGKE